MSFDFDEEEFERDVKIKVIGVGGGGGNAVDDMTKRGIDYVEFAIVNTDVAALRSKNGDAMERIQIGRKTTHGRGAGGKPEVAAASAEENKDDISEALKGVSMVFICAGMGGGTGTGAAPKIAEVAKDMNILTVGVVTKPFDFERQYKMNLAMQGIAELRKYVDALIIIPNQKLLGLNEKNISMKVAYQMVDDVMYKAVKSISDIVNHDGMINIDFEDVKATLEGSGDAHMAIGHGNGLERAEEAVQQIVESPLLETSIKNAGKLLVNFVISEDTPLDDVDKVMNALTAAAVPDVQVIHGVDFSSELKDEMEITVIATSFRTNDGQPIPAKPAAKPNEDKPKGEGNTLTEEEPVVPTEAKAESTGASLVFPADPDQEDDPFGELRELLDRRDK